MKVLIVLALAVAVASAGFTGTLNQQARPILQQAIQQIRADLAVKAPARSSAEAAFQAKFLQGLQDQVESHLNNIQLAMGEAQVLVQQIVSASQAAVTQLHQTGTAAAANVQDIVSGFLANIMGLLNNNGRALSPAMQAIVQQVVTNPTFVAMVHNSATYLCLNNQGIAVTFEMVQQINGDKPNGWNNFLSEEAVQGCIAQAGGLTHMIQSSTIVQQIQAIVKPLGMSSLVAGLVQNAVGEPWASQIVNGLSLNGRGLFSGISDLASGAWDTVSGAASGAWNSVTNGAGAFANMVSNLASSAMANAGPAFEQIKDLAVSFVMSGVQGMAQMAADQAFEMMVSLAPMAAQLGDVWTQAVDLYQSVHGVLNLGN